MTMKYARLELGTIEAVINKLGGMEGVEKFLRDELQVFEPTRSWREEDGVIYFSVTPDGTTGPGWIKRLEKKKFQIGDYAKSILRSDDFQPTTGVTTEIAVLKGMLFKDNERITKNIRAEADRRNWTKPNAEVACLMREKFSDKELEAMGLWWIAVMHEPIKDSDGAPELLYVYRDDDGRWLGAADDGPGVRWSRDVGFAFVLPKVSTQDSESQA